MIVIDFAIRVAVSTLPVILFLASLLLLDSYKLLRLRHLLAIILSGALVALACLAINSGLIHGLNIAERLFSRYGAPFIEESLKAGVVVHQISRRRVGFMVDAAIVGFGVGAGFALVENTWYIGALANSSFLVWIVRGFGTAVMHGAMTAIFAIVSKTLYDRSRGSNYAVFLPGLLLAIVLHSLYNHFILPPVISTIVLYITLPVIMLAVFYRSENSTRQWLGAGLDVDTELLESINTGRMNETRIGEYFGQMRERFPAEMLVDMVCYVRLHTELAISAKGVLLMRESGFDEPPSPDVEEKFTELEHLERSLGVTGRLALAPILHTSARDLWQLHMLRKM